MSGRGEELPRPNPWTVRAADRQAFQGWQRLLVKVGGASLEQWQYEVTGAGRIWYSIDDDTRTLWITRAGAGHPKQTDTRGR